MLARHFSHMVLHPKQSLEDADKKPADFVDVAMHIGFLALIPTVCCYIATVYLGWDLGAGDLVMLSSAEAIPLFGGMFVALNASVYILGLGICWLSKTFDVKPDSVHCIELAAFASVPLFATGFAALYPVLFFNVLVGTVALAAAVYLLYIGVPIFMHIPEDEGFMYSTWIVSIGMITFVTILGAAVFFLQLIL
jgi:Yip1 domain